MPGVMLGYHIDVGGKWHGKYRVSPLQDFRSMGEEGTLRVFPVKEVVVDTTNPVQFPLSPVKDALGRTEGPHGTTTTTTKRMGIDGPLEMKDDKPSKCVYQESEDVAEPVDQDAARDE
eukprot:12155142-Heterocapsa_arctica.AAC.1